MLDISVWSEFYHDRSPEEKIGCFLDAGLRCAELSDEDGALLLERGEPARVGRELREFADARGFSFPQGHLFLTVDVCEAGSVEVLKRWLELFESVGVRSAVLHASGGAELTTEERFERRVAAIAKLADFVKGSGLTICLENLCGEGNPRTAEDLLALIDAAGGSEELGICLDTGHLNVVRRKYGVDATQRGFILTAGSRLKALHIADNDGSSDQHQLPFARGNVNMREVVAALREVGYDRLFNFEIPGESGNCPAEFKVEKLRYARSIGEFLLR